MMNEMIATHVGLQRNFRELNNKLKKLGNAELPENLLTVGLCQRFPLNTLSSKVFGNLFL